MTAEEHRLTGPNADNWKNWGPYVSERQWGTVREDYSDNGSPWSYLTHDQARSKAYRWGEDGIAGICDLQQRLCFALAFWNGKDAILKERLFGLTGEEGNHGEDVKEEYFYLDSTPTHSYMKMLYRYPHEAFPYEQLVKTNKNRSKAEREFELRDTGIFDNNRFFDIYVEYAKASENDLLIKINVVNRGDRAAGLHVLPHLWFRNTWSWSANAAKPGISLMDQNKLIASHRSLGNWYLHSETPAEALFCENETNLEKLYGLKNDNLYAKDGINNYVVEGLALAVNPAATGSKAAYHYHFSVPAGQATNFRLRFSTTATAAFDDFDRIMQLRQNEADEFYSAIQQCSNTNEQTVQRQAFAGMLWSKQFYYYNVIKWLQGDPAQPPPPSSRLKGRNHDWKHLNNADVISMPDKWEYPWYAAWDLAFHCITLAMVDPVFAKDQLVLLTREWYMHPNGQLPAYEWTFSGVNPPVHAWAAWKVYEIDAKRNGKADTKFLESIFHKLLLNFTWWVNRKDTEGNNIFEGGFLGLDNIGVFDRTAALPSGGTIEQADGTSWMAMYALNLMRIALELSTVNPVYQDMATKFFEHFLYIASAMTSMSQQQMGLWNEEDEFFYDMLRLPGGESRQLKVRSMVGLIPLFAVEVLENDIFKSVPEFSKRLKWFLKHRPGMASLVSRWQDKNTGETHLLSLLRGHRMKRILYRMLDEHEFLSDFGIRSLSKVYEAEPYEFTINNEVFSIAYAPGESLTGMFGGNSNWRGPVWMPVNYLIIESLKKFHHYYGDDFKVECPTHSGNYLSLKEIADFLSTRLKKLFIEAEKESNLVQPNCNSLSASPLHLFFEYFHGDTGKGLGALHQTGWTGLIANLLQKE